MIFSYPVLTVLNSKVSQNVIEELIIFELPWKVDSWLWIDSHLRNWLLFFLLWGLRSFETENGISVSENGEQKRYGDKPEEVSNVARGSYSFPHDGVTYTITWYADETGYHAEGAHLPTVPVV